MEKRYCQRCSTAVGLDGFERPRPRHVCGSVNFDVRPPVHWRMRYELTEEDIIFLRTQGIDPEDYSWHRP